jgi:predicted nucleic acid-binding protein
MRIAEGDGEMLYLDTSAFLKLYVREEDSETVNDWVVSQKKPLPIWDFQEAEFLNALRLKMFWGDFSEENVETLIRLYQPWWKGGSGGQLMEA